MLEFINHQVKIPKRHLIANLNMTINTGQVLSILGKNGVGKSSLLNTFFNNNTSIRYKKKTLSNFSKQELAQNISILKPGNRPVFNITVQEYIELGRLPFQNWYSFEKSSVNYDKALNQLNCIELKHKQVHLLSDGEFQKVQIVKALVQNTPIILLDEPTSFLDFPSKIELYKLLKNLAESLDKIIIFTTHDIDMAWKFTDYTLFLNGKKTYNFIQSKHISIELLNQYFETNHFNFDSLKTYRIKSN